LTNHINKKNFQPNSASTQKKFVHSMLKELGKMAWKSGNDLLSLRGLTSLGFLADDR